MRTSASITSRASSAPGKLADAELHFGGDSPLVGLKLIDFSIWERRGGSGRNVTFPARSYVVNGDRRAFALLRPIVDTAAQEAIHEHSVLQRNHEVVVLRNLRNPTSTVLTGREAGVSSKLRTYLVRRDSDFVPGASA